VWCNKDLYLQVSALCCLNQRIMSVRIAKRKMSLPIHSYRTVSFATMWIISRMKRATTRAPWGNPDASHTPRLTDILCKSSGHYHQCSRYLLNLRDLCVNSLMHRQVCVFTDLCLSLSAVFTVLLVEYVTFVEGMAFVFYVRMLYCVWVDNYVCHGTLLIKNGTSCIQDCNKWKFNVEKARTFKEWSCRA
jgi:hypothetical protein